VEGGVLKMLRKRLEVPDQLNCDFSFLKNGVLENGGFVRF
jgi:hypothetical protein